MNKVIEYAVGIVAFFIALALSSWLFKNFLGLIGLGLFVWGIFELFKKKYVKTRKGQIGLIATGFAMILFWSLFMVPPPEQATGDQVSVQQEQLTQESDSQEEIQTIDRHEEENSVSNEQVVAQNEQSTEQNEQSKGTETETSNHEASQSSVTFVPALVTNIVDGDTIDVTFEGKTERVRLLLVDTPETKDPNEPVQPFGPEATEFAEKTLAGKEVKLEFDGPERDKYNRLLVYLWIGDKIFNQMLLEEGLARIAYVYDPPYTHYDAFVAAEKKAKNAKKGIWSIPGYATEDGFNEKVVALKKSTTNSKQSTTNEKPTQKKTQQEDVYYARCADARAAGAAPIYKGEPGYRPALDRDGDGIACE